MMRWFRRLFRRRPPPPAPDLAPFDRLAEVVERVVALLEERRTQEERRPRALLGPPPVRQREPARERAPALPAPPAPPPERQEPPPPVSQPEPTPLRVVAAKPPGTHLLFAGGPTGYRLLERPGPAPQPGGRLDLDGAVYGVVRLGPSPLPGDRRRCAFVELERPGPAAAGAAA